MRKHKEGEDMNYTISNEKLTLVVSSRGGEFQSVKDAEGQEYLWQGDAATWTDRGPNLFPYIGRMTEKSYKYQDTVYHMDIHGFLPYDEMELVEQKADSLTLRLVSSQENSILLSLHLISHGNLKEKKSQLHIR